jgi:quinol monooxygenase YgiN
MIQRIVKLHFKIEQIDAFMEVFEASKAHIRAFDGCLGMSLAQHDTQPNVLFTISRWKNTEALENYRKSPLFTTTWAKTKVLFEEKAEAWSVAMIDTDTRMIVERV